VQLDNRGSTKRGLDFDGAINHMGKIDVEDQQTGVQYMAGKSRSCTSEPNSNLRMELW